MQTATSELIYDWNCHEAATQLRAIEIDDETLRDCLQSPSVHQPDLETKRRWLRYMVSLGIQRVNLGLPMSSQAADIRGLLETIADERLPIAPGLAVRAIPADVKHVVDLHWAFPTIRLCANAFLGSSRLRRFDEGWDWGEKRAEALEAFQLARNAGIPIMFVTEDSTRTHPEDLIEVYLAAASAGADEVCIADTCGHAISSGVKAIIQFVRRELDNAGHQSVRINWHGHEDRGLGLANALAAISAGADVVHGTILGVGERCGNTPLDLLLINLHLAGVWSGSLSSLPAYVGDVSTVVQNQEPRIAFDYPAFGRDAFRHASGIHARAIIKALDRGMTDLADSVYSAVPAALVGRRQEIVIGPLSGKGNVEYWCGQRGQEASEGLCHHVLEAARAKGSVLTDLEIETCVSNWASRQSVIR